ncbi:hypothetical protein NKR23_g8314 [Pleurostoma richardsiae]|uniref:C2H2-type domain-containing protein n=1 Tax=Pleurostoma richardsiae TaxID=41990 RepID=A0AA38RQZ1_9PEZI|nr:hypothetical protein NKR23_g8314 [Pleurostoma richardsiae]
MDVKVEHANGFHVGGHAGPCGDISLSASMDMGMDFDDGFALSSHPMTYQSSRGSFSTASSFCGPFTPTSGRFTPVSGRSTPQQRPPSMDLDCSFGSTVDFELTPPSTATSSYFPMHMKGNPVPDMFPRGLPATPTRYSNMLDVGMLHQDSMDGFTQSQSMDMYSFSEGLSPSPFMIPTPPQSFHGAPGCDMSAIWSYQPDSPITFLDKQSTPTVPTVKSMGSIKIDDLEESSRLSGTARRLFVSNAQQRTSALRRATTTPSIRRSRLEKGEEGFETVDKSGFLVKTIAKGKHVCDFPECRGQNKSFNRMEHLKRHIKTKHQMSVKEYFKCDYCNKSFSRTDNRRSHMELHTKKSSRTDYVPEAREALEKERAGIKKRRPRKPKTESEAKSSE